jgi:hypothetical protein
LRGSTHSSTHGRVGDQRDVVLGARGGDAVGEHVGRPQAELDLDGHDLGDLDGLLERSQRALGQRDAAQLARLDVLLLEHAEGDAQRHVRVATRALEDVDELAALELGEHVVHGAAGALGRAVGSVGGQVDAALDAEDHLVGVFRVLLEVAAEQRHAVVLGRAVDLAAVPEVGAVLQRRAHGLKGLLLRRDIGAPGEA